MRTFLATVMTIWGMCALMACESTGDQYDGVSRFAAGYGPYHGPGSPPREAPAQDVPGTEPSNI